MAEATKTHYWQETCLISKKPRGFHLITDEILQAIETMPNIQIGLLHLFLQHTSASLTISENACRDVREDLEQFFTQTIPDDVNQYQHNLEGADDMPAHIKNVILGSSLTVPLAHGQLALGQWQGIYLCEHRNHASARKILLTAEGVS